MRPDVVVAMAGSGDRADWLDMRMALWPHAENGAEIDKWLVSGPPQICLIARGPDGRAAGFAEASIRHDYVNGCKTSPVGFLEGIYVRPEARGTGIARALVASVVEWARGEGLTELASDADIANLASHAMHRALGFSETQRVVYFRKTLGG